MTTINPILNAYAQGKVTNERLLKTLEIIGFSPTIVNILMRRAEYLRRVKQCEESAQLKTLTNSGD